MRSKSWVSLVKLKCFNFYSSCSMPDCYGQRDLRSEFLLNLNFHWHFQSLWVPHIPVLNLKNQQLQGQIRKTEPDHSHRGTGRRTLPRVRKLAEGCLTGGKELCFHVRRKRDLRETRMVRCGKTGSAWHPAADSCAPDPTCRNCRVRICPAVSRFVAVVLKTTLSL